MSIRMNNGKAFISHTGTASVSTDERQRHDRTRLVHSHSIVCGTNQSKYHSLIEISFCSWILNKRHQRDDSLVFAIVSIPDKCVLLSHCGENCMLVDFWQVYCGERGTVRKPERRRTFQFVNKAHVVRMPCTLPMPQLNEIQLASTSYQSWATKLVNDWKKARKTIFNL